MKRPRFSVVILAQNEGRALPRLLEGLVDFRQRGGEVLLVDTGSVDDTVAIALEHGCRMEAVDDRFDSLLTAPEAEEIEQRFAVGGEGPLVAEGQRLFHFGAARQWAGWLAANDFVLQIDGSDEVLALDVDTLDGYLDPGGAGAFEYSQIYGNLELHIARFYDRRRYRWVGRVHEHIEVASPTDAAPAAPPILCDPAQLQIQHHKDEDKPRTYLAGLARQVLEDPKKPRWWHYLGRELFYQGWYESAIPVLERHAAMEGTWIAERSQSLCFVGECHDALGRVPEADDAHRRAFALDATRREPLLRRASLWCRCGDFEVAARCATEALGIPRTSGYPELQANYSWLPHSILYWSLFWLGRKAEAREHWEICMDLAPEESRAAEHARFFPPAEAAS